MATNKTPVHKRIKRAESGREDWKMKALLRREENEKLKSNLKTQEECLLELTQRTQHLEGQLKLANKKISQQEHMIEDLKKKSSKHQ